MSDHPQFAEIPEEVYDVDAGGLELEDIEQLIADEAAADGDTALLRDLAKLGEHDTGNAQRIMMRHGANIVYCKELGWHLWNGRVWERDSTHRIVKLSQDVAHQIKDEAPFIDLPRNSRESEDDHRKRLEEMRDKRRAFCNRSLSARAVNAAIEMAKPHASVSVDAIDADDWHLVVRNGVVDLGTGELKPHDRELYSTKAVDIEYRPEMDCPTWKKVLREVFKEDEELLRYFQKAAGYALTGDTSEHAVFIGHGNGANGKSTVFQMLLRLTGDYGHAVDAKTLMDRGNRKAGEASPDLARLKGVRCAVAMESRRGESLDEETIKALTGGDRITARHLYGDLFEFDPKMKIFMGINHKPKIDGIDNGIWRRVKLIPFENRFVKSGEAADHPECPVADPKLEAKLERELPGILAWAVEGCQLWLHEGLADPDKVKAATSEYRTEMDRLADFLGECVAHRDPVQIVENGKQRWRHFRTSARDMYDAYVGYCYTNAEKAVTQTSFGKMMRERGFAVLRSNGKHYDCCELTPMGQNFASIARSMDASQRREVKAG